MVSPILLMVYQHQVDSNLAELTTIKFSFFFFEFALNGSRTTLLPTNKIINDQSKSFMKNSRYRF